MRFVVPTSTSRAPERASTSGILKPSPISISSPRETSTSRPSASAASASITAAALLLTTSAASAPVIRCSSAVRWSWRDPRAPGLEVVLEVGVAPADLDDAVERGLGERGAAEVRVDQHAGRVEHAPQRRPAARRELGERCLDEVAGIAAVADLLAGTVERHARRRERERVRHVGKPLVGQQAVDRGSDLSEGAMPEV